jgi:hypothetical protein
VARRFGSASSSALTAAATLQAVLYLHNYFVEYPAVSATAFENFGFKQALMRAVSLAQNRVVVDSADNQPYISASFFSALLPDKTHVPIIVGDLKQLAPGDVLVFADPQFEHRELREGLPAGGLYAIADFEVAQRSLGQPY